MKRVFTKIDTNKRNVFHDGLSRKKNTLPAYRSQGGGDHLISPALRGIFMKVTCQISM
ncbi:hypothetical protein CSO65_001760 [Salmonella enterica subsp. diarizonae]|nr:hypothetical protein [Salmonella enterica subsp. diarizonae]EDQ8169331.1 hypothetical protein [Salmonella enterica subsp. diarizonae]